MKKAQTHGGTMPPQRGGSGGRGSGQDSHPCHPEDVPEVYKLTDVLCARNVLPILSCWKTLVHPSTPLSVPASTPLSCHFTLYRPMSSFLLVTIPSLAFTDA